MLTKEGPELVKVATVGASGWFATLTLERINVIVSIAVGVATLAYVCIKIYFAIKNRGKVGE